MPVFAQFDITGKIAVVTGTSRGLGKGYAEGLARAGAVVMCCGVSRDGTEATVKAIRDAGGKAEARVLDVSKPDDSRRLFEDIAARCGRLDILVNNAGTEDAGDFVNVT